MNPRLVLVALLIAAVAACGGDDSDATGPADAAPAQLVSAIPKCADVFADGTVPALDEASPQCMDPDGTTQVLGAFRCADGSHLVTVDKKTGAFSAGWYISGEPFHPVDEVASDPEYGAAYSACNK